MWRRRIRPPCGASRRPGFDSSAGTMCCGSLVEPGCSSTRSCGGLWRPTRRADERLDRRRERVRGGAIAPRRRVMIPRHVEELPSARVGAPVEGQKIDGRDLQLPGDVAEPLLRMVGGVLADMLQIREDHHHQRYVPLVEERLQL